MDGRLVCKAPAHCHQHPFNNVHTAELTALLLGLLHASSEIARDGQSFCFSSSSTKTQRGKRKEKKNQNNNNTRTTTGVAALVVLSNPIAQRAPYGGKQMISYSSFSIACSRP